MSAKTWLWAVVGLNLVACALLAGWGERQRRQAATEAASYGRERAQLTAQARDVRSAIERRELEKRREEQSAAQAAANVATTSAAFDRTRFEQLREQFVNRLHSMPEYAGYLQRTTRRSLLRVYGRALEWLKLDPDVRDAVLAALVDQELTRTDIMEAAKAQGLGSSPFARQMVGELAAQTDAKLQALLGEEKYAEYESTVTYEFGLKQMMAEFFAVLADHGMARTTDAQNRACCRGNEALFAGTPPYQNSAMSREEFAVVLRPRVSAILPPEQLELFIDHAFAYRREKVVQRDVLSRFAGR